MPSSCAVWCKARIRSCSPPDARGGPPAARSAVADSIWGPWRELGNPCEGDNALLTYGGQSTYVSPVEGKSGSFIAMFDLWRPQDAVDGRYMWLPVIFMGDGFKTPYLQEWDLSHFDK